MNELMQLSELGLNAQTVALLWFAWKFEKRLAIIETALISIMPKKGK